MSVKPYLSTLSETAEYFRCSTKTFKKDVIKHSIPHLLLGKRMLFDLKEVETFLKRLAEEKVARHQDFFNQGLPKRKLASKKYNPETERYARMLE